MSHAHEREAMNDPKIAIPCPACGSTSLFLSDAGWLTCSVLKCPDPGKANLVLKGRIGTFGQLGLDIGNLVDEKNHAYGSSWEKCGEFLKLLYPNGMQPDQYQDALLMVRIFDKQMRIANKKDAFGESPYRDIAGYGILGASMEGKEAS